MSAKQKTSPMVWLVAVVVLGAMAVGTAFLVRNENLWKQEQQRQAERDAFERKVQDVLGRLP